MSLRCWPSKTPQISSLIRWDWCGLPDTEFLILLNFQNDQKQEWGRVDAVVMDRWCNWPLVVWAFRVILLLSSLWFIWNNYICQIPASYTSMASNIRNWPITPGLLYLHPATVSTQPRDWAANLTTLWSQPCQSSSGKLSSDPVQSFSEHASNFFIVFVAQLSPLSL